MRGADSSIRRATMVFNSPALSCNLGSRSAHAVGLADGHAPYRCGRQAWRWPNIRG